MGHRRNMAHQLSYAVRSNFKEHVNKHSLQVQGITDYMPKSYETMHNCMDRAEQFGRWVTKTHPDIRMARDLNESHFREWLEMKCKSGDISTKTATAYQAQLRCVAECSNKAYHTSFDVEKIQRCDVPPERMEKVRCHFIDEKDWAKMRATAKPDSALAKSMDISHACGIRVAETSRLKGADIRINGNKCTVTVIKGKNGRTTTIKVADRHDIARLQEIKEKMGDGWLFPNARGTHLKPDSLNHYLRNAMKEVGVSHKYPNSTFHAERKAWARREFEKYSRTHTEAHSKAWISQQLEHRDTRGEDSRLMSAYLG